MINKSGFIVYLEISSFIGAVGWAEHYYGEIWDYVREHKSIEVTKKMTSAEAKRLNKSERDRYGFQWKAGHETSRIETVDGVKEGAKKMWKKHFPDAKILMYGSAAHIEPKEIIDTTLQDAEPDRYKYLNDIAEAYQKLDETLPDNDKGWVVRKALNKLWEEELKRFVEARL